MLFEMVINTVGVNTCHICCIQIYSLGQLCLVYNQILAIGYRPGDVIVVATSLVEAAVSGMRKTGIKCGHFVPRGKCLHDK